jgi:hypothetical protein
MKERITARKAWLITWEGKDAPKHRPKVVAILPPRLGEGNVIMILEALFKSEYPYTLSEKMYAGLAKGKDKQNLFRIAYSHINRGFYYGQFAYSYLFAREVKNLHCKDNPRNDFEDTLSWTELEKRECGENLGETKVILPERQASYTYSTEKDFVMEGLNRTG